MANTAVHTGFWIDHSRSSNVLGATVTLDANWGSQLVSAAAIVVQIIGFSAWTIIAFVIHQRRAVPGLRDEYDAQLQVLLRNTQAADSTAWSIFSLGRTWQGRKQKVWRSAAPLALFPAVLYAAFIVAGVFVGQIATNSYDRPTVLVAPGACGFISVPPADRSIIGYSNLEINITSISSQYARSCYSGAGSLSAVSCSTYAVPSLKYHMSLDEPCPIPGGDACFPHDDESARPIRLETAALDSHYDFGINAPSSQRLKFQYRTSCAPLSYSFVDSFTVNETIQKNFTTFGTPPGNATLMRFEFGEFIQFNGNLSTRFYYYPIVRYWGSDNFGYTLQGTRSILPHDNTTLNAWLPVAPLNQTPADLNLIMLTPNSVTFTEPVEDPMFRTGSSPEPGFSNAIAPYGPKRPAYFMACGDTYQICNPVKDKCTGWNTSANLLDFPYWQTALELNEQQNATFTRMAALAFDNGIVSATIGQTNSLLAQSYLISATGSLPLPKDQWRKEVQGWFETVLARFQLTQTVFSNIPLNLIENSNVDFLSAGNVSDALAQQCMQQRVASPQRYQSYNLFALVFIFFFGIIVPGTAVLLRSSHSKLWRINPKGHRYLSFQGEELMQLHRMALEGRGYNGWEGGIKETPRTTVAEERIPQVVLEAEDDEMQPMLRYPRRGQILNAGINGHSAKYGYEEVKEDDSDVIR